MIRVLCEVPVIEIDNRKVSIIDNNSINVESHWNLDQCVVLVVGGKRYTVKAAELRVAIENATNVERY